MPSSDELLSQMPLGGEDEEETPYLGVPKGYTVSRPGSRQANLLGGIISGPVPATVAVKPLYFKGDEFQPSTLAVEDRAKIQLALRAAGLYTPRQKFQLGVWDEATRGAYRKLLEYANGAGLTWNEALNEYATSKAQMGDTDGEDSERAPLTTRLTNPMDIRRVADSVAPAAVGRRLRPEELERLVSSYQTLEASEQQALYNADETGGTVTGAPALETFTQDQARQIDPEGAEEMDWLGASNEFFQMLTSARAG